MAFSAAKRRGMGRRFGRISGEPNAELEASRKHQSTT